MNDNDSLLNDKKHIVSIRLNNVDRIAIRSTAARLFIRESELYRFAINQLLNRLHVLHDDSCTGSDLLPLFLELRDEIKSHLNLKKFQLFQIFNNRCVDSEKFVAMSDVELLVLPSHAVRQRLQQIEAALQFRQNDTNIWLSAYLKHKYQLAESLWYAAEPIKAE